MIHTSVSTSTLKILALCALLALAAAFNSNALALERIGASSSVQMARSAPAVSPAAVDGAAAASTALSQMPTEPAPPMREPIDSLSLRSLLYRPIQEDTDTVVVCGVDGMVYGLDTESGDTRWSFSTGRPLFASHSAAWRDAADFATRTTSAEEFANDMPPLFLPSADGSIYAMTHAGLNRLPITVRELVANSPFQSSDGTVYIGWKHTHVFAVDPMTGNVYQNFSTHVAGDDLGGLYHNTRPEANQLPPGTLFVGRADYSIRAIDLTGIERWNITIGEYLAPYIAFDKTPSPVLASLEISPEGSVYQRGSSNGRYQWHTSLPTAIASAYSIGYDTTSHKMLLYKSRFPNFSRLAGKSASSNSASANKQDIYIDSYQDQLFVIPIDPWSLRSQSTGHMVSTTDVEPPTATTAPGPAATTSPYAASDMEGRPVLLLTDSDDEDLPPREHQDGEDLFSEACSPLSRDFPHCLRGFYSVTLPQLQSTHTAIVSNPALPLSNPVWHDPPLPSSPLLLTDGNPVVTVANLTTPPSLQQQFTSTTVIAALVAAVVVALTAGLVIGSSLVKPPAAAQVVPAVVPLLTDTTPTISEPPPVALVDNTSDSKPSAPQPATPSRNKKGKRATSDSNSNSDSTPASTARTEASTSSGSSTDDAASAPSILHPTSAPSLSSSQSQLVLSNRILGYGSSGTIVYEGQLAGRKVAVKRMLSAFYDVAHREVSLLLQSDEHKHVVRYYTKEQDGEFIYLVLSYCEMTLEQFIEVQQSQQKNKLKARQSRSKRRGQREASEPAVVSDPAAEQIPVDTMRILQELVTGLEHLHSLNIVHRDLKPQNVLLDSKLCVKISDMGLAKKLDSGQHSFSSTNSGSAGWQAPELLANERQTKSVDIFALGCIIFYILTNGQHPFGNKFERDANIIKGEYNLTPLNKWPEARHLVRQMIQRRPDERITAARALLHPLFWSAQKRLMFLKDASDRLDPEKASSPIVQALEARSGNSFDADWSRKLSASVMAELDAGKHRKYNKANICDLLRVIRNKGHHYRDLPPEIQEEFGPLPEGFVGFFLARFPGLLLDTYEVMHEYCHEESTFVPYFT